MLCFTSNGLFIRLTCVYRIYIQHVSTLNRLRMGNSLMTWVCHGFSPQLFFILDYVNMDAYLSIWKSYLQRDRKKQYTCIFQTVRSSDIWLYLHKVCLVVLDLFLTQIFSCWQSQSVWLTGWHIPVELKSLIVTLAEFGKFHKNTEIWQAHISLYTHCFINKCGYHINHLRLGHCN